MNRYLFSMLIFSLFCFSCKRQEITKADPYIWLEDYKGNFTLYFTDTSYKSGDPFSGNPSDWSGQNGYSTFDRDGTLFRITENKIKIHDYNIELIQDYPIVIDQNKKFTLTLDTTYSSIHEIIKVSGHFINKDSITYSYYDDRSYIGQGRSYSKHGVVNGSRIKPDNFDWLENYIGNFKFHVTGENRGKDDNHSRFINYISAGTIFRTSQNNIQIKIGNWTIDSLIVDRKKKITDNIYNTWNMGCGNSIVVVGEFINKDSLILYYNNDTCYCDPQNGGKCSIISDTISGFRLK